MNKKKIRKIFGYHLAMDLYGCQEKVIKNLRLCYHYLDIIPTLLETSVQSPPFIFYDKKVGICGFIPIVESGISLYINFSLKLVSTDIYSCKKFKRKKIEKYIINFFRPKRVFKYYLLRAKDYIHPVILKTNSLPKKNKKNV